MQGGECEEDNGSKRHFFAEDFSAEEKKKIEGQNSENGRRKPKKSIGGAELNPEMHKSFVKRLIALKLSD